MARRKGKRGARETAAISKSHATVFLPDFPEQVKAIAMRGVSDDEMAQQFGISEKLMQDWKRFYPDFAKAIDDGRTHADVRVVQALFHRAIGYSHPEVKLAQFEGEFTDERIVDKHYPPDFGAIKYWLNNRQREHWKDRTEHAVGGSKDMPDIGVGVKDETKAELVSSILALITPQDDDETEE